MENQRPIHTLKRFLFNIIVTIGTLLVATIASCYFQKLKHGSLNICLFYILSTILTALFTSNYICGGFTALASVFFVNYFFAYPSPKLDFSPRESPLTFCVMLSISLIICTITINLKESIRVLSEREKLLVEAEKEKMRANLLRAVSHDLRTPLTSIIGASNTYLENGNSLSEAEKEKLVSHILEDSNWLLDMVENLLSVTRIHNDAAKVTKSLEPIEEVVSEAVFRLKKRLPEASIKVKVPEEFLMIPMDAILIEQVIINLLENAVVHSHSPKPIQCIVSYDKSIVAFHVIDFGIGIAPEKLDTLFDGTTHTSGSSDRSKGMGIGLCICKTIILAHDGSITARNHEQGVEFIFTLPRDEKQVKENTKKSKKGRTINIMSKYRSTILIIEDEENICNFISTTLSAQNYQVIKAYTGVEGLSIITSQCPNIVLLDLGLPDMDGLDIIRQVRTWSAMPILVISARTQEHEKVEALDLGADDYIPKPFGTSELLARIRTAERHSNRLSSSSPHNVYHARELTIDFTKHLITVRGKETHLTQVEFKIVALLAQNSGRVMTYDSIISSIWGPYADNNNRILRVNMANIRRKLELNPAEPEYILTEIGIGYRMIEDEN